MKKRIHKIGPVSLAKLSGVVYGLTGLVFGLIITAVTLLGGAPEHTNGFERAIFGTGAPIFLTILYGLMGFLFGFVGAWVYNLCAKWVGGIEIELEDTF